METMKRWNFRTQPAGNKRNHSTIELSSNETMEQSNNQTLKHLLPLHHPDKIPACVI
jgi:hypothetical protein